ncbi:hypothetical protein BCR33DRAFT_740379 [Rhizoclosmatium globosum]|uniref:Uncharacterized protein n=1 Tax=Rhizoclosmatium globosum TaxID=329046 RepID=A0A1Y2C0Q9_9FUNG|nr:hypothetical protein BCR33DRAFT_740379 [Rhizoclosmatium globosum]|eukprot:ORY40556.1 hypothetical protein BCR33DRAFT_740379 [Rhizoclosmatium globosum]
MKILTSCMFSLVAASALLSTVFAATAVSDTSACGGIQLPTASFLSSVVVPIPSFRPTGGMNVQFYLYSKSLIQGQDFSLSCGRLASRPSLAAGQCVFTVDFTGCPTSIKVVTSAHLGDFVNKSTSQFDLTLVITGTFKSRLGICLEEISISTLAMALGLETVELEEQILPIVAPVVPLTTTSARVPGLQTTTSNGFQVPGATTTRIIVPVVTVTDGYGSVVTIPQTTTTAASTKVITVTDSIGKPYTTVVVLDSSAVTKVSGLVGLFGWVLFALV